jgi:predicted  nucleic acid-binding Zn-ribbon protein
MSTEVEADIVGSPSNHIESESEDGQTPETSKRESIRARLRAQEERLTKMVRSTSGEGIGGGILNQMKSVEESLKQMEEEKSLLEQELNKLKNATDDDEYLKEKMSSIQEGFEKQLKKIQSLQDEVDEKNNEIDMLRTQLVMKLQRIVELEFDLETHEIHYTTYAAEQFKLGEEALDEIKIDSQANLNESTTSIALEAGDDGRTKKLSPRKAQKLISKLLADLDSLEIRYKEEKLKSLSIVEKLKIEKSDLEMKCQLLEDRARDRGDTIEGDDPNEEQLPAIDNLGLYAVRKRCETLEARMRLQKKELTKLEVEIENTKRNYGDDIRRTEIELEHLNAENEALKARLREFEDKKKRVSPFSKNKGDKSGEMYADIEEKIKGHNDKLVAMESSIEIKNRQIDTLKKEVTNLRMREISEGKIKDSNFTTQDSEVLRSGPARSSGIGLAEGVDNDYVRDMQRQLQEAQQQLVKKDQELVIERAKAASTAAGLLARITELSGKRANEKGGKQVPLRFYL